MFNQGRNSLRGQLSCSGLIQHNLSLLKLQLTWKYLWFWNDNSVHSRKGVGFQTDIIWNSPFVDLKWVFFFLIRSWRKKIRIIWFNIISSAQTGAEMQNWMEIIKKSSKMVTPLLTLFFCNILSNLGYTVHSYRRNPWKNNQTNNITTSSWQTVMWSCLDKHKGRVLKFCWINCVNLMKNLSQLLYTLARSLVVISQRQLQTALGVKAFRDQLW